MSDFQKEADNIDINVNIEKHMKQAIKDSKYIKHVVLGDILDEVTQTKILELLESPKNFIITDEGLAFVNNEGETEGV